MKKLFTVLFLICAVSVASFAGRSDYMLNSSKVDLIFDNAVEINLGNLVNENFDQNILHKSSLIGDDVQTTIIVAWVVDWTGLGALGIHRYVLGTKPSMFALYFFTCGGIFGVVPVVDWFVLLIDGVLNENGEKYIDNEKFLMWM